MSVVLCTGGPHAREGPPASGWPPPGSCGPPWGPGHQYQPVAFDAHQAPHGSRSASRCRSARRRSGGSRRTSWRSRCWPRWSPGTAGCRRRCWTGSARWGSSRSPCPTGSRGRRTGWSRHRAGPARSPGTNRRTTSSTIGRRERWWPAEPRPAPPRPARGGLLRRPARGGLLGGGLLGGLGLGGRLAAAAAWASRTAWSAAAWDWAAAASGGLALGCGRRPAARSGRTSPPSAGRRSPRGGPAARRR